MKEYSEDWVSGLYNDDGTKIDPMLVPKPSLCVTCKRDGAGGEEDMLCILNRNDQQGEPGDRDQVRRHQALALGIRERFAADAASHSDSPSCGSAKSRSTRRRRWVGMDPDDRRRRALRTAAMS